MRSPLLRNTNPSESPGWSTRVRENLAHFIAPSGLTPSSSSGAPIHLLKLERTTKAASAQTVSLLTHAGILVALTLLATHGPIRKIIGGGPFLPSHETLTFERRTDLTPQRASLGGLKGGGGNANPIPATHGFLQHSSVQLMSPRVPDNVNHQLPVEVTILDANAPPAVSNNNVGLPWMPNDTDSGGSGHQGIGGGKDGGAGDLEGSGDGWSDGDRSGRGISIPVCDICPFPVYTDEARHVKVQGTVTLRVLVGANGKAAQIRVVRGVGYGLDDRAIETVRGWKFTPAHDAAGRNVPAWVIIETVFRLF
jgi:protein TonB